MKNNKNKEQVFLSFGITFFVIGISFIILSDSGIGISFIVLGIVFFSLSFNESKNRRK